MYVVGTTEWTTVSCPRRAARERDWAEYRRDAEPCDILVRIRSWAGGEDGKNIQR